jgi:hypothetical protein
MMSAEKIAKKIMTKDTCYGMYDHKTPTDDELAQYFAMWINEYAKDYHKSQTIKDKEDVELAEKKKIEWWNNE